jgi:coproporphyrinogen III oxidase
MKRSGEMSQFVYLDTLLWMVGSIVALFGTAGSWMTKRLHDRINHLDSVKVSKDVYEEFKKRLDDHFAVDHEDHKRVIETLEKINDKINKKKA